MPLFKKELSELIKVAITIKNAVLILIWTAFGSRLNLFNQNTTLYLIPNRSAIIYSEWGMEKKVKNIFLCKLTGGNEKDGKLCNSQYMQQRQQKETTTTPTTGITNKPQIRTHTRKHACTNTYITFIYCFQSLSAEFCYEIIRNDKYARFLPPVQPARLPFRTSDRPSFLYGISLSLDVSMFICVAWPVG